MDKEKLIEKLKGKKTVTAMVLIAVAVMTIILFLFTDFFAIIFNNREYRAYKYAIECVEDELKFPNTATYPSFKDTKVEKSKYGAEIIVDLGTINSSNPGKSFNRAWDISGSGTCENALGMEINYSFLVTVVIDDDGDFWCYQCILD